MSGTEGISGGRRRAFTDEEIAALHEDASTSAIVNEARRDAGYKEPDVAVRGNDRTLDQVLHDQQTHVGKGETIAAAAHAIDLLEAVGVGGAALHALGRVPAVALPAAAFVGAQYAMYEMEKKKMEMRDGATRDQLHAAIVTTLEVPQGFKNEELKRLNVSVTNQSAAKKIGDQFLSQMKDAHLLPTLQLHCDQGMHAARDMIDGGKTKEAFMKARPDLAQRYDADPAFKNGFDALVWANGQPGATYAEQMKALESRDARYDQAHVQYRL
jgi:hypothetical protein